MVFIRRELTGVPSCCAVDLWWCLDCVYWLRPAVRRLAIFEDRGVWLVEFGRV